MKRTALLGFFMMSSRNPRAKFTIALTTLLLLTLTVGCRGFFVNPTVTSLTIGPSNVTITKSQTQQMAASANFSDNSPAKDVTGQATWTSSEASCGTINSSGLVTPSESVVNICTTSIGASFGTVSATPVTLTITPGAPTSIQLDASPTTPRANDQVTFTASAIFPGNGTPQPITTSVTWINSDPNELTLTNGSATGTISATATVGNTINVQASFNGVLSNTVTLTITQ